MNLYLYAIFVLIPGGFTEVSGYTRIYTDTEHGNITDLWSIY